MSIIAFEVLLVLLLIVANGIFAMSELAIVSARKVRLQRQASEGSEAARAALELANTPDRFLSTVQIGITLIGILAGAFGGATIAEQIAAAVSRVPALAAYGEAIGLAVVVVAITYFSLVIGELVPKRLALSNTERIALLVARPMRFLSWLATPFVSLLSFSTSTVVKLLRLKPSTDPPITEEEIKIFIEQGTQAGVFDKTEQELVGRIFRLGDRRINVLMTPRRDVLWLDIKAPEAEIFQEIKTSHFSRFPVCNEKIDNIVGVIKAKEYLAGKLTDPQSTLKDYLKEPLIVPEYDSAFHVLERFKSEATHLALIVDEFGAMQGIVTTNDFLEAVTGEAAYANPANAPIVERGDGSWLIDASLPIDEFAEFFGLKMGGEGDYQTLAGLILAQIGHIPAVAEIIEFNDLRFEIVDLDGRRIDKVLVSYIDSREEIV